MSTRDALQHTTDHQGPIDIIEYAEAGDEVVHHVCWKSTGSPEAPVKPGSYSG